MKMKMYLGEIKVGREREAELGVRSSYQW